MRSRATLVLALLAALVAVMAFAVSASGAPVEGGSPAPVPPPFYYPEPPPHHHPPHYYVPPTTGTSTPESKPDAPGPGTSSARPRLSTHPQKRTHGHFARFHFTGGKTFEAAFDHGPFRTSGATFFRRVKTGKHVLRVRTAAGGPVVTFRWLVLPRR
jgi:hypothetical protein